jgi:hypothetical protein
MFPIVRPHIVRAKASAVLGIEIDRATWIAIVEAFLRFGQAIAPRSMPKVTDYVARRTRLQRSLVELRNELAALHGDRAMWDALSECVFRAIADGPTRDHEELSELFGHRLQLGRILADLEAPMADLKSLLDLAEPRTSKTRTENEARVVLVRGIRDICRDAGLPCDVSSGWALPEDASESDLSPFEQLLSALGAVEAESPSALSATVRRLMEEN